ncbi:MAG: restriction modification system specificity subunit [Bacteroidetes bacterium]|nr:restriction modification system specificity subunit [Bacteroidota bacterium]
MNKISDVTLGDLIEFQRGFDLPKSSFVDGDIPVISSNGILGFHNEYKVEGPGITIGRSGTVGLPHYIESNFYPHNTSLFVKNFKGNNPRYIYYLLKTLKLNKKGSGSGVPTMNRNHLHPLKVKAFLDSTYQGKIANILTTLDSKISLNNRINAELEAMAKTVYDYWFVQFDFPNTEGKPYKSSGGKMVWSEELKREVPEGWEVFNIGKLLQTSLGGTPSTSIKDFWKNGTINWLNSGEIANFPIIDSELKITVDAIENSATELLPKGSVLLSITRHLRPSILGINACANQSVVGIKEAGDIKCYYLYPYLQNEIPRLMSMRTGAQQPHINKEIVDDSLIIMPPKDSNILKLYNSKVGHLYESIINNAFQNQQLSSLRDWLLPMLMNGQVKLDKPSYAEVRAEEGLMAAEPGIEYKNNQAQLENYHKIQSVYTVIWANSLLGVYQGEMALAKDTYLVDKIAGLNTGFTFAQHNWGSYDPTFKKTINNKQYFVRRNYTNSKAIYFDLNDNGTLIDKIPDYIKESVRKTIEELDNKIFGKYHWHQKAEMKELYATVLKCIEDTQSIDLNVIRQAMTDWKTPKQEFSDKAAKFTLEQTKEALDLIVKEKWHLKVIVEH